MPILLQVFKGTQCLPTNVIAHILKRAKSSFNHETQELDFQKLLSMKLMFWNSYLYRHICALTPASVRIRKTQIQNVDEMLVMRNNGCLKVGEEKAFCCENTPTDWNAEIRKYGMHKQEHSTKPCRSCSELLGLFGGLIFKERKWTTLQRHSPNFSDMAKPCLALMLQIQN